MSVGNWRSHLLIKCAVCSKLMGHYKPATTVSCVDCEIQAQMKQETTREATERLYLSYFNDFLTIAKFAEYHGMSERKAMAVIKVGRKLNHRRKTNAN